MSHETSVDSDDQQGEQSIIRKLNSRSVSQSVRQSVRQSANGGGVGGRDEMGDGRECIRLIVNDRNVQ